MIILHSGKCLFKIFYKQLFNDKYPYFFDPIFEFKYIFGIWIHLIIQFTQAGTAY